MMDIKAIDFARLLGFATVSDAISEGFDFLNEAVGARLGAKVGAIEQGPAKLVETIDVRR